VLFTLEIIGMFSDQYDLNNCLIQYHGWVYRCDEHRARNHG
jgi:hypothetical protein